MTKRRVLLSAALLLGLASLNHSFVPSLSARSCFRLASDEIEFDEDDVDVQSYAAYKNRLAALARTASRDPTAVAKANDVFDQMFQAYLVSEDAQMWPQTDIYNLLIRTHACSRDKQAIENAEMILGRMGQEGVPQPDAGSYNEIMKAYAMRRDLTSTKRVLDQAPMKTIELYNTLLMAYAFMISL